MFVKISIYNWQSYSHIVKYIWYEILLLICSLTLNIKQHSVLIVKMEEIGYNDSLSRITFFHKLSLLFCNIKLKSKAPLFFFRKRSLTDSKSLICIHDPLCQFRCCIA